MKYFLSIPLLLALVIAVPAFADDAIGESHDEPVTNTEPQPLDKPLLPPPPTNLIPKTEPTTTTAPKPPQPYEGGPEKPTNFRPLQGSSTNPMMPRRQPLPPGDQVRPNMGSTTPPLFFKPRETFNPDLKQAILEHPQGFASTTRAIFMDRRAHFASSTAAQILEERKELRGEFGSTTRPLPPPFKEHFGSTTLIKAELAEDMKERVLAHAEHAAELMHAMLGRLAGIAERIAERIELLSAEGIDVSVAEAELAEAYDAIDVAEAAIEAAKEEIEAALESEDPKAMLGDAKSAGQGAKEALRAAHEALKEAAEALKPPQPEEETI